MSTTELWSPFQTLLKLLPPRSVFRARAALCSLCMARWFFVLDLKCWPLWIVGHSPHVKSSTPGNLLHAHLISCHLSVHQFICSLLLAFYSLDCRSRELSYGAAPIVIVWRRCLALPYLLLLSHTCPTFTLLYFLGHSLFRTYAIFLFKRQILQ